MGNYVSCALSVPASRRCNVAEVILPDGEIKQFDRPTRAAELMLEAPNHFIVNLQSLRAGERFTALSADDELRIGDGYAMFPMRRLKSVVTPEDLGKLSTAASDWSSFKRPAKAGGKGRVLQEACPVNSRLQSSTVQNMRGVQVDQRLNLAGEVGEDEVAEIKAKLKLCRSRKPLLETIAEESVCSNNFFGKL